MTDLPRYHALIQQARGFGYCVVIEGPTEGETAYCAVAYRMGDSRGDFKATGPTPEAALEAAVRRAAEIAGQAKPTDAGSV